MTTLRKHLPMLLALTAALLAACGGSGEDATIGGTITGLSAGLSAVLADNATSNLTLTGNGNFTFGTTLATGATYDVTVVTQPLGETCTVANGSGTVNATDNVTDVAVSCVVSASIVGTVSGLAAGTSVTLGDGTVLLPIASNGAFAFPGVLTAGSAYAITIAVQPAGETCVLGNAAGTIPAAGVASITVTCS
jgi:uncharacterized protein with beta-barrel porin domain